MKSISTLASEYDAIGNRNSFRNAGNDIRNMAPRPIAAGFNRIMPMPGKGGPITRWLDRLDKMASSIDKLADAVQSLADAIGGSSNQAPSQTPTSEPAMAPIAGSGRIWGDPHFIGADGGKFDVQGKAGKVYNLLSDKGFQMNGRFDSWGSRGATVVGQVGIKLNTGDNITVEKNGNVYVSGAELKDGQSMTLNDGTTVRKSGKDVHVQSKEWKVDIQTRGNHINMDVSTKNAVSDGVKPHGLLGQTFDGDGQARNGDKGTGAQGGGAIEGLNGNMISRGDRSSVEAYEVNGIYDTAFRNFNADQSSKIGSGDDLAFMQQTFMSVTASLNYTSVFNSFGQWS